MFNLQTEIKGPGSMEEAGNIKGDDVIVHMEPFLIVSFISPRRRRGLFSESKYRDAKTKQQKEAGGWR